MSDNVYAPPLANLDLQPVAEASDRFYIVATRKMLVLFFLTIGMYQVYWYYKNWALHKRATGEDVWPVPRAIFALFFTHSLYHHIATYDASGKRDDWDYGSYATAMVFLLLASSILTRFSGGQVLLDIICMSLLIPIGLVMKQAQAEVNARCGDPLGASNSAFTTANYVWCGLGGLFWLLVLVGLPLPE